MSQLNSALAPFQEGGRWWGVVLKDFPGLAEDIMAIEVALVTIEHRHEKLYDAAETFVRLDMQLGNFTPRQMRRRDAAETVRQKVLVRAKLRTLLKDTSPHDY